MPYHSFIGHAKPELVYSNNETSSFTHLTPWAVVLRSTIGVVYLWMDGVLYASQCRNVYSWMAIVMQMARQRVYLQTRTDSTHIYCGTHIGDRLGLIYGQTRLALLTQHNRCPHRPLTSNDRLLYPHHNGSIILLFLSLVVLTAQPHFSLSFFPQ